MDMSEQLKQELIFILNKDLVQEVSLTLTVYHTRTHFTVVHFAASRSPPPSFLWCFIITSMLTFVSYLRCFHRLTSFVT